MPRPSKELLQYRAMIGSRFFLALVGGYGIAAFSAKWIARAFTENPAAAAMSGTMLALMLYCAVFMWVFAVRSTAKVWLGVALMLLITAIGYWFQVN